LYAPDGPRLRCLGGIAARRLEENKKKRKPKAPSLSKTVWNGCGNIKTNRRRTQEDARKRYDLGRSDGSRSCRKRKQDTTRKMKAKRFPGAKEPNGGKPNFCVKRRGRKIDIKGVSGLGRRERGETKGLEGVIR